MLFADHKLNELSRLDCKALAKSNEFPIAAIRRRDLMHILKERFLENGGVIQYASPLFVSTTDLQNTELTSVDGETKIFDLLLATDGIGSRSRDSFFKGSRIHYQGIRTFLGASRVPFAKYFQGKTFEIWGFGSRFMMSSLDGETVHWSAMERTPYESNSAPIPSDLIENLLESFAAYHPYVLETIKSADFPSIHRSNFGVVKGLKTYHHNSIVLIGDAAHGMPPNMGQGASLALEDAAFLASKLRSSKLEALESYSRARKRRADELIQIANSMNTAFQPNSKLLSLARNSVARLLPNALSQRRMSKVYELPFTYQSHKV
jgi:2-polyprenyl-6-methoxyphenol hydroxylase-like FAD-dependent oxidoreductase